MEVHSRTRLRGLRHIARDGKIREIISVGGTFLLMFAEALSDDGKP